jgi:L-seryl-tRNA(Ser) seleniumtransferase
MSALQPLSALPKMDHVLDADPLRDVGFRRDILKRLVAGRLEDLRARLRAGETVPVPDARELASQVAATLRAWSVPHPRRVLNATGVLLHTNLGRAPLADTAVHAMAEAARACDLEIDMHDGTRGSRFAWLRPLLSAVLGSEDAHVVNNNAAALLLACTVLGDPGGVVLSRGQMVEIGDGFRVATMAAAGGCRIVAVGSTNRTHASDYEAALAGTGSDAGGRPASALLWVHLSNFSQDGFVKEVPLHELAAIARARGVPLVADLGSGSLGAGLPDREPTIGRYLEQGADLVLVSGDKLLGGPQAGILAGRRALVERCRRHPMARALRPDKTSIAALHATLLAHAHPDRTELPLHRMVAVGLDELQARAEAIASALGWGSDVVVASTATIGGGSLPGDTLPSRAVRVPGGRPSALAARLRMGTPALVGRIEGGALLLDLRTIAPQDDADLVAALRGAMA